MIYSTKKVIVQVWIALDVPNIPVYISTVWLHEQVLLWLTIICEALAYKQLTVPVPNSLSLSLSILWRPSTGILNTTIV